MSIEKDFDNYIDIIMKAMFMVYGILSIFIIIFLIIFFIKLIIQSMC